jgi:hypothetical protein
MSFASSGIFIIPKSGIYKPHSFSPFFLLHSIALRETVETYPANDAMEGMSPPQQQKRNETTRFRGFCTRKAVTGDTEYIPHTGRGQRSWWALRSRPGCGPHSRPLPSTIRVTCAARDGNHADAFCLHGRDRLVPVPRRWAMKDAL